MSKLDILGCRTVAKVRAHFFFRVCSELSIGSEQTSKARGSFQICAYYTTKGIVVAIHPQLITWFCLYLSYFVFKWAQNRASFIGVIPIG